MRTVNLSVLKVTGLADTLTRMIQMMLLWSPEAGSSLQRQVSVKLQVRAVAWLQAELPPVEAPAPSSVQQSVHLICICLSARVYAL